MEEYSYTESDLNLNLNELAHESIRELYNAAKKVAVYSSSHPLAEKAIGRPFLIMGKVFRFKTYFNLHISSGQLYALNIRIRVSIFSEQIMEYMQALDLNSVLFETGMTVNHLNLFLERFVKKLPTTDYQSLMVTHLEKNKIGSIRVNDEIGSILAEKGRKFFGDVAGDFSVRNLVGQVVGNDIERLAAMLGDEHLSPEQYTIRNNHDFYPSLVRTLIPEKIISMEVDYLVKTLLKSVNQFPEGIEFHGEETATPRLVKEMFTMLNYHPQREEIIRRLDCEFIQRGIRRDAYAELFSPISTIRLESAEKIDLFLNEVFSEDECQISLSDFQEHFEKLLRTGQQGKARAVINYLVENLAGEDSNLRGRGLELLALSLSSSQKLTGTFIIEHLVTEIDEYITAGEETFEFSDLIWELARISLAEKQYDQLSALCTVLAKKCRRYEGVMVYDSLAVKKAISELDRREIINQLVWELMDGHTASFSTIKNILVTIGSEEVALALSHIISHESRQLRQNVLKILSELGKASLNIFTRILEDDTYFEREELKRELPDSKWYIVRNAIFVLGALKDPEGCKALRMRIADEDVRVRQAIISALEKIGGDRASDLLLAMAEDPDREIREAAIIALGIIGKSDIAPELINLALKRRTEGIQIIVALGNFGGEDAKKFLSNILTDPQLQSELTSNRSSREELKLAAIKALGKIGDDKSIETIRKFTDSLSASQKIFFGAGKLTKIAEEILDKTNRQS